MQSNRRIGISMRIKIQCANIYLRWICANNTLVTQDNNTHLFLFLRKISGFHIKPIIIKTTKKFLLATPAVHSHLRAKNIPTPRILHTPLKRRWRTDNLTHIILELSLFRLFYLTKIKLNHSEILLFFFFMFVNVLLTFIFYQF